MASRDLDAERLLTLLSLERELLVTGRLDRLPKIEAAKATALARIAARSGRTDPAMLQRLRTAAASNQRLYDSALTGIQRVRDRVAALIAGGGELRTYAPDGARQSLAPGAGRLERRA